MKKILITLLAAAMIIQAAVLTGYGESAASGKKVITVSNLDTLQLTEGSGRSSTQIDTTGIPSDSVKIVSEEWTSPAEYVISGSNITIRDGKYSYRLVIRSDRTLTFDNDLEIYYQGVDGRYKLHYDIDRTDNHTMIVTGVFDNIIISSPLLDKLSDAQKNWILSHISKDSYFYQLILKTKEGFSFVNTLRYLFDAHKCGYSIKYKYDLLNDKQTIAICGIPDCDPLYADAAAGGTDKTAQQPETGSADPVKTSPQPSGPSAQPADGSSRAKEAAPPAVRTVTVSYSKLRKRSQTIKASAVFGSSKKGTTTYTKTSGNRKIKIDKKTGKITAGKGLAKGAYSVTVRVRTAGAGKSKATSFRTVKFILKVA